MASIKTAIELTDGEARVLQVRIGKERQVKAAVRISLPLPTTLDPVARWKVRAEAFRDGLRAAGLRVTSAVVVIPKRNATLRYVVLPSTEDGELTKMARFEAERHIPFNAQRHVISHCVMRKDDLQGSHVLIAAIDEPELEEVKVLAETANFDIDAIDISSLAHYNTLSAQAPADWKLQTVGYLHAGRYAADISIASKGLLMFARSVPYGTERLLGELREITPEGKDVTLRDMRIVDLSNPAEGLASLGLVEMESQPDGMEDSPSMTVHPQPARNAETILRDWLNRLSIEIQRSYEFAQRELDCPPISSLVVAGDASRWPNFDAYIGGAFNVETQAMNTLHGLTYNSSTIEETHWFLATTGALARYWQSDALAVNLIPPSYRAKGAAIKKKQSIAVTSALAFLVLLLGYLYLRFLGGYRQEQITTLQRANAQLAPLADELLDREKQLAIISGFRNDKRSALAILDTISSKDYFPRRVAIKRFEYNKGDIVTIRGLALTIQDLTQFEINLKEATYQSELIFKGGVVRKTQQFGVPLPGRAEQFVEFEFEGRFSAEN